MAMMHGKRLMPDDDWHVHTSTSLLLRMMMTLMLMLTERLLQLLMLAAYRDAVDVHRYWHHKSRRFSAVASHRCPDTASAGRVAGASTDAARQERAATAALNHPGLDALPLGSAVLEPDLDLHLAETQLTRDHRAFGQ